MPDLRSGIVRVANSQHVPVAFTTNNEHAAAKLSTEFRNLELDPDTSTVLYGEFRPRGLLEVIHRVKAKIAKQPEVQLYPLQPKDGVVPLGALAIDTGWYKDDTMAGKNMERNLLKLSETSKGLAVIDEDGIIIGFDALALYDLSEAIHDGVPVAGINRSVKVIDDYLSRTPLGEESLAHQFALLE